MGHLFYTELSGVAGNWIMTSGDVDLLLFSNIMIGYYWSGSVNPSATWLAMNFRFFTGQQLHEGMDYLGYYAWAVHDGDIGEAVVPVPTAVWLFGSGLLGLSRNC